MARRDKAAATLLKTAFTGRHVDAAVKHFEDAVEEFQRGKWDDASAKCGRFIEAVLKALWVYAGQTVPSGKDFKAGSIIDQLERMPRGGQPDTIKTTIPRACRFAYEVASNRGARHDPDEIDASEMDAQTVLSLCAWILSEMIRFAQKGRDLDGPAGVVAGLMKRRYPFVENIDGRVYADIGDSAKERALVILHSIFPKRMSRADLIEALVRHPFTRNNAIVAVSRIVPYVDDDGDGLLRLRNTGLRKVDELLEKFNPA